MSARRKHAAKTGKSATDIFSTAARPPAKGPGRPPSHDEAWTKVTVVLFNRQIVFLDRLAANIRAKTGAAVSRAQLIRALIDAVTESDIDLTTATSEQDVKSTLTARIGRFRLGL